MSKEKFWNAATSGDVNLVSDCLEAGADVNYKYSDWVRNNNIG